MQSIAWWPTLAVVVIASVWDLYTGRIPNWLVLPFLITGLITQALTNGIRGFVLSFAAVGLAAAVFGSMYFVRAMGMGDVKLAAGIGAWIGPEQFALAMVAIAISGGLMAVVYALCHRSAGRLSDNSADLLLHLRKYPFRPHPALRLGQPGTVSMPYAPAIAVGTLFSFFAS